MTAKELYETYARWTGHLHFYCIKYLGVHIDCQFFPDTYRFGLYSGHAQEKPLQAWNFSTVPALTRPIGEAKEIVQLPRPEDNPTTDELDMAFKGLCLAAARVLEVDLGKAKLPPSNALIIDPGAKKHASRKRLRNHQK
jgi:hypothetical protein